MLVVLQWFDYALHCKVTHYFIEVPLVLWPVVKGDGNTLGAKPTSSSDPVQVGIRITNFVTI